MTMSNAAYGHIDMHKCRLRTHRHAHICYMNHFTYLVLIIYDIYIYVKTDYIEIFFEPIVLKNGRYSDD